MDLLPYFQFVLFRACCFRMTIRKGLTVSRLCGALSERLFETQRMWSGDFCTVKSMAYEYWRGKKDSVDSVILYSLRGCV